MSDLFFKLQDRTVKKLYETGAVAQGLDVITLSIRLRSIMNIMKIPLHKKFFFDMSYEPNLYLL